MLLAKILWAIGSIIITFLGSIHLYYTFFSNKFSSKNVKMIEEMKSSSPILTKETTMWNAWIGFNASHSSGAMFIGIVNLYLVLKHFALMQSDPFFFILSILTLGFYTWLGKKYWFTIPYTGILITLVCFMLSYLLTLL